MTGKVHTPPAATSPARGTIAIWHQIFQARDFARLGEIVRADAVFRSPAVFKPYEGRDALVFILSTVAEVFEDFRYHREFYTDDGLSATLEFSARVGDRTLEGIDMIAFDGNGLITEFKVMVRPRSGLQALADAMAKKFDGVG